MSVDVVVIAPFRRPTFRKLLSPYYPTQEPWDSAPLVMCAVAESAGLSVEYLGLQNVFDAIAGPVDEQLLADMLRALDPTLVLFASDMHVASRSTATVFGIELTCRILRSINPHVIIGATGRLATTAVAAPLEHGCDFAVHGEAEGVMSQIMPDLVRYGLAGTTHSALETSGAESDSRVKAAVNEDLGSVPPPAWHKLERSLELFDARYPHKQNERIPVSMRTSAGCKFQCRFCAGIPNWNLYRTKSAGRVGEELDAVRTACDGRLYLTFLEDEIFTRNEDHVRTVAAQFLSRDMKLDGLYTHSSLISAPIARLLADMTSTVYLGLDSPDDGVLKDMRKGQRFGDVLDAVNTIRDAGLKSHLEWIIGSPPETVDSLITSLNAIVSLLSTGAVSSVNTYVYCAHPGTEYAERADDFGLTLLGSYDEMQESGGYPAHRTHGLSRQQIFLGYLLSQLAINEVSQARAAAGPIAQIGSPDREGLRKLLSQFGENALS